MNATDLIDAIESALDTLEPVYRGGAAESDLYEAALFAVVVDALTSAGGTLLLTNDGVSRATVLRFRRGPGYLWNGQFTHAIANFPNGKALEAHLGVYVIGGSGVAHESDVAIINQEEAERSRIGAVHPRRSGLVASIEAKHYVASPGIGIGRGFLGLSSGLTRIFHEAGMNTG